MSLKLKVGNGSKLLEDGTYEAVLSKIEQASNQTGQFLKWSFEVSSHGEAKSIIGTSPLSLEQGSKTRIWTEALRGRALQEDEEVDLEQLVGRTCKLVLTRATLDQGREVNKIERVLPKTNLVLSAKKATKPAVAEEEDLGSTPF